MSGNKPGLAVIFLITALFVYSCGYPDTESAAGTGRKPVIEPDYTDVTIPPNIAPMNFAVQEDAKTIKVIATSSLSDYKISIKTRNGQSGFPHVPGKSSWTKAGEGK